MIGCKEINDFIVGVEKGIIPSNENIKKNCQLVKKAFANESIYVDREQWEGYKRIGEMMFEVIYPWEYYFVACTLCTYTKQGKPRWFWALAMLGRGAGKDGVIAWISLCLVSKYNNIPKYDVDICANNEDQATRPVKDVIEFLERPDIFERNKKSFHWTKEEISGLFNKGKIKGHTNSPKGKDGLRTGCLIMNEVHQYESYSQIKVFTTGLGKKPNPRRISFTTNGEVSEGVLDDYLENAEPVLNGDEADNGHFYFLWHLDSKDEVDDEKNWYKANPSLAYNESLLDETRTEYLEWKKDPYKNSSFMTKRMNLRVRADEKAVVDYDYIKATDQPMIDLTRKPCIAGIDASRTTDMASVSLWFKVKEKRYVINHNWICTASQDWEVIAAKEQFPKWVEMGILTIVDSFEINPKLLTDWIQAQKSKYNIMCVAIDDFRQSIFARELGLIGFTKEQKNLKLTRLGDVAKVVPNMESWLLNMNLVVGENPCWRWACNNTKVVPWKARTTDENELGNQVYAKIDKHKRKTDPFMSTVAAASCDLMLPDTMKVDITNLRVHTI